MTIIDKYISSHPATHAAVLSAELGVSEAFVRCRRLVIYDNSPPQTTIGIPEEIHALIHLIDVRQKGWAVDAARIRIYKLNELSHKK